MRSAGLLIVLMACGSGTKATPTTETTMPAPDPGSGAPVVSDPPAVAEAPLRQVTEETVITTAWQATIAVPANWHVSEGPEVLRVRDPEKQLEVAFTAVKAATLADAIKAGWARIKPDFALKLDQEYLLPGRSGWDGMGQQTYITSPDVVVAAVGMRKGETWYVTTIEGPVATVGARGAQLNALVDDMKVPGVDHESFAGKTAKLGAAELARLDAFYEEARQQFGAPGGAMAIVHGGKIVFEKGYGVRSLGAKKPQKVTPSTKFMIGSTTKSLTTLLLARLVDAKKLQWTSKVVDVLPTFKLADPAVTSQVTVQHTVCACTGMPRHDLEFLFEYEGWTPEQRLASMAEWKPTTGFGETFQYSNEMVATGGWIAGHVVNPKQKLGPAYDAAMQSLVFKPLGMTSTTLDFKVAQKGDHALPHARGMTMDFQPIPVAYETAVVPVRPAGAAWSTVHDMAKYVALELAKGKVNGRQLVSEENLVKRREPQVKIDAEAAYGLGLFLSTSNDLVQVSHGGNNLGFTSEMMFFPEHDVGIVMLSNAGGANALHGAVVRYLKEVMFDAKPEAKENLTESLALRKKAQEEERALVTPVEEAWVTPLLGTYKNPALGELSLEKTAAGYVMNVGEWQSTLAKKTARNGVVYVTTIDPPYVDIAMTASSNGDKQVLTLDAGQIKYDFVKVK